jgi:hypothetical protein
MDGMMGSRNQAKRRGKNLEMGRRDKISETDRKTEDT